MKNLSAWSRLIRWPNLLIVALTQGVAWWTVVAPLGGRISVLRPWGFALLCLSTVLIAAAGYIINDYFDIRIDVINKPEKVILERLIPRRAAIKVHWLFNGFAMLLAAALAIPAGHPEWLLLQLLCIGLLWRYSTTWKRQFMIGNVIVALMTALTIAALVIYEPGVRALRRLPAIFKFEKVDWRVNPLYVLIVFAGFAFILTWMREIVKDMEDYKGDDAEGCMTMPIRWGLLRSTRFVQVLSAGAIAWLVYCAFRIALLDFLDMDVVYFIGLILVPALAVWTFRLPRKATSAHYHQASRQLKLIMVLGIIALFVYYL